MKKNISSIKIYGHLEWISELLIYFIIIFPPWAFGSAEKWAIWTYNIAGYLLGTILIIKKMIRQFASYQPLRWDSRQQKSGLLSIEHLFCTSTIFIIYCLISTANAKAYYIP